MKSKITAAPYLLWALILIIIPLILVAIFALTDTSGGFTLDNFKNSLEYAPVIFNSIWLSIIATAICLVLAYGDAGNAANVDEFSAAHIRMDDAA